MGKKCIVGAGVLVVGAFLFAVLLLPGLTSGGIGGSIVPDFYDENGVLIPLSRAYYTSGVEVTAIGATVTWTVTGTDIDLTTADVEGTIKIFTLDYQGQMTEEGLENIQPGGAEGTKSASWILSSILSGANSDSTDHWTIRIYGNLNARVMDNYGEILVLDPPWEGYVQFSITWEEHTGSFELDATIG